MSAYVIVKPVWTNDVTGEKSNFYDEMGTPAFYMIRDILIKHFGDKIWVTIDRDNAEDFYISYVDKRKDNLEIIKNIYEPHTLIPIYEEHMPSAHITFEYVTWGEEKI